MTLHKRRVDTSVSTLLVMLQNMLTVLLEYINNLKFPTHLIYMVSILLEFIADRSKLIQNILIERSQIFSHLKCLSENQPSSHFQNLPLQ